MRDEWIIKMTAKQVQRAAKVRAGWHRRRAAYWKREQGRAEKKAGKITRRKVAVTGGYREEMALSSGALSRLGEAKTKAEQHLVQAKELDRWIAFLAKRQNPVEVNLSDAVCFGIVK